MASPKGSTRSKTYPYMAKLSQSRFVKHTRTLRSNQGHPNFTPMENHKLQDEAAKLFNTFSLLVINCTDFSTISKSPFNYLMERIKNTRLE